MPTVGSLIEIGATVFAKCHECSASPKVDLAKVAAAKGDDYDLLDKTTECKTPDCGYWLVFYVNDGRGTRLLMTPDGNRADGDRRTVWLAKNGVRRYALKKAALERKKAPASGETRA